jgi:hypothetical protein
MPLFEIVILKKATKKEIEDGNPAEELLYGPKAMLARDKETAGLMVMRSKDVPDDLDLNKADLIIRPFG